MPGPARKLTELEVSTQCVDTFLHRGSLDVTVEELAGDAGVSRRTFHRYFPTKESCILPLFDSGASVLAEEFARRPDEEPITESVLAAFQVAAGGELTARTVGLAALVGSSPVMLSLITRSLLSTERLLAPTLARRLGTRETDPRVTLASTLIAAVVRRSFLDGGDDPQGMLRSLLGALEPTTVSLRAPTRPASSVALNPHHAN